MPGSPGALVPKKVRGFLWLGCQGQLAGKAAVATVPGLVAVKEGGRSRELEGLAASSHPEAPGYSEGHLDLGSQGRHTVHAWQQEAWARPFPGWPHLHNKRSKLEALVQWAIYKNQSQPLLPLLPPSIPDLLLPPPAQKAQPDHMASSCSFRKLGLSIPAC